MNDQIAERSHFFRQWVRAPLVTASIVPSSQALATSMVRHVLPDMGPVVELGPGTGVITRHLVQRGVREQDLVLVECNHYFAHQLHGRFPEARMIQSRAEQLDQYDFNEPPGVVVSGLPLMSMPNEGVSAILKSVFSLLRPGGQFIQFTYAPRCPVNRSVRERNGLVSSLQEIVWRNIPPAGVYQLKRIGE